MGSPLDALAQAFGLPAGYFNSLYPNNLLQTTPVQQDRTPMEFPSSAPQPNMGPSIMGGQFSGPQMPQGLPPQLGQLPPSGIPSQSQMQQQMMPGGPGMMPPMGGMPPGMPPMGPGMPPPGQFPGGPGGQGGINPLLLIQMLLNRRGGPPVGGPPQMPPSGVGPMG